MIYTIDVKTNAVSFDRHNPEHIPMARNQFGDATPGYLRAWIKPNYPMPAIRLDADINDIRVQIYNDTHHKLEYFYSF